MDDQVYDDLKAMANRPMPSLEGVGLDPMDVVLKERTATDRLFAMALVEVARSLARIEGRIGRLDNRD